MVRGRLSIDAGREEGTGSAEQNGQRNGAHVLLPGARAASEEVSLGASVLGERGVAAEGSETQRTVAVQRVDYGVEQ